MHSRRKATALSLLTPALALLLLALAGNALLAQPSAAPHPVTIYFVWGDGCPHCEKAWPFLRELAERYPKVEIRDLEIWKQRANRASAQRLAAAFGHEAASVPIIFVGERYWVGWALDPIGLEIEAELAACSARGCRDRGGEALAVAAGLPTSSTSTPGATPTTTLSLPLLGQIDLGERSLLISTTLIAFVDGFNACSLWVLSVLLAITLHTGSRRKVLIIGLTFLTVTSLIYALFIAGLFSVLRLLDFAGWARVLVALIALGFALINIKDYFWYRVGPTLSIPDSAKPGLYRRMRGIVNAGESFPALIGATIVMSAGASMIEFGCTAGFPVLWSNLLATQGADTWTFVGLLLLYMLIYQLDELAIFLAAVITLRASRIEERHGRMLKLASGMLMLALALTMLFAPMAMAELGTALLVFLAAGVATVLVIVVQRLLLRERTGALRSQ
jgi:thiol-disulfide isomerase/thioredoxin